MDVIRARLGSIAIIFFGIVLFSPTPVPRALVDAILKAQIAGESGRPDAAVVYLQDALQRDDGLSSLQLNLAEAALALNNVQLAESAYLNIPVDAHRGICVLFDLHLSQQDYLEALEIWNQENFDCEVDTGAIWEIIQAQLSEREFQLVEAFLETLSLELPADPKVQFHRGLLLATVSPESAIGLLRLADELATDGNSVVLELVRSIEDSQFEQNDAYSLAQVGQVLGKHGYWNFASRAFQSAVNLAPNYADAHAFLGLSLDQIGENGFEAYERAIELAGDQSLPYIYLGMHWLRNGYPAIALNKFERARELEPENPIILVQIGQAHEQMGDLEIAIDAYRAATEMSPQDADFWLVLAQASINHEYNIPMIGQPAARNAVALNPTNANAVDALGYSYYLQGDLIYAERLITRAIELDSSNPLIQYHLGLLRAAQNQLGESRAAFEMAVLLDPEGTIGKLASRSLETLSQ